MTNIVDRSAAPAVVIDVAPPPVDTIVENTLNDVDSTYAPSVYSDDTTSLDPSIRAFREENGRTYHSYGTVEHWGPNDERAQDQQDLSHHVWTLALKDRLFLAPVNEPQRILDIGTGTGIWVMDVADQYPIAQVIGTDLSPIQPAMVPPNAHFEIIDYNVAWQDENKYDLIHARELLGTSPDWPALYQQAFKALKPGGWFEQHEPSFNFRSDNGELPSNHFLISWSKTMQEAGIKSGLHFDIGDKIKDRMEAAGFVNVIAHQMEWHIGGWSEDEHKRELGQSNRLRIVTGIEDFCQRRFINNLGFSLDEVTVHCAHMRNALRDKKVHGYNLCWFVYGQKPGSAKAGTP